MLGHLEDCLKTRSFISSQILQVISMTSESYVARQGFGICFLVRNHRSLFFVFRNMHYIVEVVTAQAFEPYLTAVDAVEQQVMQLFFFFFGAQRTWTMVLQTMSLEPF